MVYCICYLVWKKPDSRKYSPHYSIGFWAGSELLENLIIQGSVDPLDIAAFIAGGLAVYTIDKFATQYSDYRNNKIQQKLELTDQ